MDLFKMFKANNKNESNKEDTLLDDRKKQHYETLIIAKETYYTSEELIHDEDYQYALEILGYPRTDQELNFLKKR